MKKISTLFLKDPNNLGRVIERVNPKNEWVHQGQALATRKYDGTACAIIANELYKRYNCKIDIKTGKYKRAVPQGAIPCQEADPQSGHHPHWVNCQRKDPADKWHVEAFDQLKNIVDGTYELCGPKVQGNPEQLDRHQLIKHGSKLLDIEDLSFEGLKAYLSSTDIEGIVFHHQQDGRMCKLRKKDFGIKR